MTALQVDGILQPPPNNEPWEYSVVISIKNTRGEEVTRQVVGVGALQPNEQRTFTVSVEVTLPQGAVVPVGTGGDVRIAPR